MADKSRFAHYRKALARLTPSEKIWCVANPTLVGTVEKDAEKALSTADRMFPESVHNGAGDAFRHCFWSALMTRDMGFLNTYGITSAHEDYEENPPEEKAMDTHNNLEGMVIGIKHPQKATDVQIKNACVDALKSGKLKVLEEPSLDH